MASAMLMPEDLLRHNIAKNIVFEQMGCCGSSKQERHGETFQNTIKSDYNAVVPPAGFWGRFFCPKTAKFPLRLDFAAIRAIISECNVGSSANSLVDPICIGVIP